MTQTIKNIKYNNKVSLVVWNSKWEGCQLTGTAEYFILGKWKDYIKKMKENEGLPAKGSLIITLSSLT